MVVEARNAVNSAHTQLMRVRAKISSASQEQELSETQEQRATDQVKEIKKKATDEKTVSLLATRQQRQQQMRTAIDNLDELKQKTEKQAALIRKAGTRSREKLKDANNQIKAASAESGACSDAKEEYQS